jgi:hypothetical protein
VARKVAAAEPRDQVRFWQGRFRQAGSRSDDAEGQGPSHQIGVPEMAKDIVKVPYPNLGGLVGRQDVLRHLWVPGPKPRLARSVAPRYLN